MHVNSWSWLSLCKKGRYYYLPGRSGGDLKMIEGGDNPEKFTFHHIVVLIDMKMNQILGELLFKLVTFIRLYHSVLFTSSLQCILIIESSKTFFFHGSTGNGNGRFPVFLIAAGCHYNIYLYDLPSSIFMICLHHSSTLPSQDIFWLLSTG